MMFVESSLVYFTSDPQIALGMIGIKMKSSLY